MSKLGNMAANMILVGACLVFFAGTVWLTSAIVRGIVRIVTDILGMLG